eukprot:196373-Amphidinium_carterae.1
MFVVFPSNVLAITARNALLWGETLFGFVLKCGYPIAGDIQRGEMRYELAASCLQGLRSRTLRAR